MTSRLAVIAIDAIQPRVVADFWCAVLGWHVLEEDSDIISIGPRDSIGPSIDVPRCPRARPLRTGCISTSGPMAYPLPRSSSAYSPSARNEETWARAPTSAGWFWVIPRATSSACCPDPSRTSNGPFLEQDRGAGFAQDDRGRPGQLGSRCISPTADRCARCTWLAPTAGEALPARQPAPSSRLV